MHAPRGASRPRRQPAETLTRTQALQHTPPVRGLEPAAWGRRGRRACVRGTHPQLRGMWTGGGRLAGARHALPRTVRSPPLSGAT
ncbi:hypothetical protein NDU88_010089 [Pleurodeles waltl]|uniref:Uncharacterized protein n=1 Tax=Pleurodeles waltl TaxID=8319 RepID=A0AAV7S0A4_PLEWA|nr:hypothetical protein NDU88_010089 [Pleurodeles waltl]